MSVEIRDWALLMETLCEMVTRRYCQDPLRIDDNLSLKLHSIPLGEGGWEMPEIAISSISSQLPPKFLETLPPSRDDLNGTVVPHLYVTLRVKLATAEQGVSCSATLSLDQPIPTFLEFDGTVSIKEFSFEGVLEVAIIHDSLFMIGIQYCDQIAVSIKTAFGDPSKQLLHPHRLDAYLIEKARKAVELLKWHPIIVDQGQ
jgi:hypothetical protein